MMHVYCHIIGEASWTMAMTIEWHMSWNGSIVEACSMAKRSALVRLGGIVWLAIREVRRGYIIRVLVGRIGVFVGWGSLVWVLRDQCLFTFI